MSSETVERRPQQPPKSTEPLACPRCESTNTKFCYYNNYNLSQPRHFCKSCRRYWTQGGALRNIPVGGGTRKNPSKRPRSSTCAAVSANSTSSTTSSSSLSTLAHEPEASPAPLNGTPVSVMPFMKVESSEGLNLNESYPVAGKGGNFCGLLNSQQGQGFMEPYMYGQGIGMGIYEMGVGLSGRGLWSFPGMNYVGGGGNGAAASNGDGGGISGCNTWQLGLGDAETSVDETGRFVDGDCFTWPSLAISTPGKP